MQTKSPAFEEFANLMTNAFGAAKGVGDEVRAAARSRADKLIEDMDLVSRDEFEAMKMIAINAQAETEAMGARVKKLEAAVKALKKSAK